MSYTECLEKAGAEIHAYDYQDDYQGTAIAYLTYEGKTGFVSWSFGSCSHCDAYEGMQWEWRHKSEEELLAAEIEFGKEYLSNIMTKEEALDRYPKSTWDLEDTIHDFIQAHGEPAFEYDDSYDDVY